jgi:TetR/AcrR family transcriptional regulator, tetracycline repressor protein
MPTTRSPGQRAGLTRTAVIAAARQLLASGGPEAVTIRAVARTLRVAPNALYSHVTSRAALLDDLLDDLLAHIQAPAADAADPVAGLHALMTSTYEVLTSAPDLVPLYLARQGSRGPHALHLGEITDVLLERTGVVPAGVPLARRVLIVHTIGSAAFATGYPTTANASAPTERGSAPEPERPISPQQSRATFDRSLDWLLAGIAASSGGLATP